MTINYADMIKENAEKNTFNVRDEFKHLSKDELDKLVADSRLPYAVAALNVTGDLNVSGIIRSASMFGAEKVLIIGRKNFDRRGAVGAQNYVKVEKYSAMEDEVTIDPDAFFKIMEENNYVPIAVETGGKNISDFLYNSAFMTWGEDNTFTFITHGKPYYDNMKPCFIMGQEGTGIPESILTKIEHVVTIPQLGPMRSLNVASAASIVMYEVSKYLTSNFVGLENAY